MIVSKQNIGGHKMYKIELGDLVEFRMGARSKLKKGIVKATDKAWWVLKNHLDVSNHIVSINSCRLVEKAAVRKDIIPYI